MSDWQQILVEIGDTLLGWTLRLPRDLCLLIAALLFVVVLLVIRRLLGDSDALRQLSADKLRNRELTREAKVAGSREELQRLRGLRLRLSLQRLRLEFWPVLFGVVPALVILSWGSRRLEYLPLRVNEPFELQATFGVSAIGDPVHVVPDERLQCASTWIQIVEPSPRSVSHGVASWVLRSDSVGEATLQIRHRASTLVHAIEVGTPRYREPTIRHEVGARTHIVLNVYRPMGGVPGMNCLGLPAWLVGFLLLAIPLYFALRRMLRIP